MKEKEQYFESAQRFLDFADNIADQELKENIINSYFSSISSLCKVTGLNYDELCDVGKNFRN